MVYPEESSLAADFRLILNYTAEKCCTNVTRDRIFAQQGYNDIHALTAQLMLIQLMRTLCGISGLPISVFDDIRSFLDLLKIENYVLDLEQLKEISAVLQQRIDVENWLDGFEDIELSSLRSLLSDTDAIQLILKNFTSFLMTIW